MSTITAKARRKPRICQRRRWWRQRE